MEFILALSLAVVALFLLWLGARQQRASGLPAGRVIYTDPRLIGPPERPFYDAESMLTGKPDYLVEDKGTIIPVEVKSGWAPPEPHEGHIYQLLAYCLLVERATGKRPPYGILRYRNRSFAVDYTREGEQELLRLLEEMHEAGRARELHRSHEDPRRCLHCGYRSTCEEKL
jgi:CRISPR-associated exonuclease Cas4